MNMKKIALIAIVAILMLTMVLGTVQATSSLFEVKLTFNANGGDIGFFKSKEIIIDKGDKIGTLPTATKKGWVFGGWYTSPVGGTKITKDDRPTRDTTYYAQWKTHEEKEEVKSNIKLKLTFDANGGEIGDSKVKIITINKGDKIETLPKATSRVYNFQGWYNKKSGGTKITTDFKPEKDTTFYAQWKLVPRITWDANGGKIGNKKIIITLTGVNVNKIPRPVRTLHSFQGWYRNKSDGQVLDQISKYTKPPTKDTTYYAQWKALKPKKKKDKKKKDEEPKKPKKEKDEPNKKKDKEKDEPNKKKDKEKDKKKNPAEDINKILSGKWKGITYSTQVEVIYKATVGSSKGTFSELHTFYDTAQQWKGSYYIELKPYMDPFVIWTKDQVRSRDSNGIWSSWEKSEGFSEHVPKSKNGKYFIDRGNYKLYKA